MFAFYLRRILLAACTLLSGLFVASTLAAADALVRTVEEDFSTDPLNQGWNIFGQTNLFHWNPAEKCLAMTWDSSQSNSYLRLPLQTLLTRRDDFSVSLDLKLNDIVAGADPDYPGTFQIAFGFQNRADAEKHSFIRGTGDRSPNLVEFNFFPDTGYGPTVWPAIFPTSGKINYSGRSDFKIFDLPLSTRMRITLSYSSSTETASITILADGKEVGPVAQSHLAKSFTDFQVDTFSITSYSQWGQGFSMPGSILAHGAIDNLVLHLPTPPIQNESSGLVDGHWEQSFLSREGWQYVLMRTSYFTTWEEASGWAKGTGSVLRLQDREPGALLSRFYRVLATRSP